MTVTIGDAARRSGCPASTIRYYERVGLLRTPARGANGYRYYDRAALDRLQFVHRARALGFSVDAAADLLKLADHPQQPCDEVDHLLAEQIATVRGKIAQLRELETELSALQAACDGGHAIRDCGVMATLADER